MKLDDLLVHDASIDQPLDPDLVKALEAHGFVHISFSLYQRGPVYVAIIGAVKSDGTGHTWIGSGKSADEAEMDAVDALSKWMINQMTPNAAP